MLVVLSTRRTVHFKLERYGPANRWYVTWSEGSRSKRWSTRTTDQELAEKRRKAFVTDLLTPREARPEDMDLGIVLCRYRDRKLGLYSNGDGPDDLEAEEIQSKQTMSLAIDHFLALYEGKPVSYLTKSTTKAYVRSRRKAAGHPVVHYNNRRLNVLRAALNDAVDNEDLVTAPRIPSLPVPTRKERWLSRSEAARLLWACRAPRFRYLALFIKIGLYTGARHSAILQLTWDRGDREAGRVDLRVPGLVETKKRRPHSHIPDRLLSALRIAHRSMLRRVKERTRKGEVPDGKYVIEHRGGPLLSVKKAFREACERAGITDCHPARPQAHVHHLGAQHRRASLAGLGPDEHQCRDHREGLRAPCPGREHAFGR